MVSRREIGLIESVKLYVMFAAPMCESIYKEDSKVEENLFDSTNFLAINAHAPQYNNNKCLVPVFSLSLTTNASDIDSNIIGRFDKNFKLLEARELVYPARKQSP